jgi:hypothetical protein
MEASALEALDAEGFVVLNALQYGDPSPEGENVTHARPHSFVCQDGRTYWVKRTAQSGLASELIAGRLGGLIGASPDARIVRVTPETGLPASANHLLGIACGSHDQPGMENFRKLSARLPGNQLDPAKLDAASRLLVLAFQTWIGTSGDVQILIDVQTGRLLSIDHGDCFANPADRSDPTLVATPGVPPDFGRDLDDLASRAVKRITDLGDEQLLQAVARMPTGAEWNADAPRRLEIAEWLGFRRDRLGEVINAWMNP